MSSTISISINLSEVKCVVEHDCYIASVSAILTTVYNIFNEKYENNGYSQTCALVSADGSYKLSSDPRFYPMAGTNVLAHLTFSF